MRYKVSISTLDGRAPRVYTGRWRGADAAVFGAMRRDQYALPDPGRTSRRTRRAVVIVNEDTCEHYFEAPEAPAVRCERDVGHRGEHHGSTADGHIKRWR